MDIQALLLTSFRLVLGIIFLLSFVGKASEPHRFATILATFKLIPHVWVQSAALSLIFIEMIVAILLLVGWQTRLAAVLSGSLLLTFALVMGLKLLQGQTDLDCGCLGAKRARKVSIYLVGRNTILLMMAVCIVHWGGGFLALDSYPLILENLITNGAFLPIMLVCIGTITIILLIRQLYRLLLLVPLEE